MTIQAVFFDFGGVLLQFADGVDHKALEARFEPRAARSMRFLYRDSRYMDFQVGKCTQDEWQGSIRVAADRLLGAERAREVLAAYEKAERPLNPQMLSLIERLRRRATERGSSPTLSPGWSSACIESIPHIIPMFDVRIGSGDLGSPSQSRHLPPRSSRDGRSRQSQRLSPIT